MTLKHLLGLIDGAFGRFPGTTEVSGLSLVLTHVDADGKRHETAAWLSIDEENPLRNITICLDQDDS